MKKKKLKIDLEAIALYQMAKNHYKKSEEFVIALAEHYGYSESDLSDLDLWYPVIEQMDFDAIEICVKEHKKKFEKKSGAKKKC
jgi:hypothetical protein